MAITVKPGERHSTVLVVDDDALVANAISQSLTKEGFFVEIATNVHDALARFQENTIDVVLTDLIMPGANGMDLLRHIELRDSMVPVIIITGDDSVEAAANAVRERAFDYLTKPVGRDDLIQSVRRAAAARTKGQIKHQQQEELKREHRRLDILNKRRASVLTVLFNRAVEGIIIWDREGHLVDASDSFFDLVAEDRSELINSNQIDRIFEPHPADGPLYRRIVDIASNPRGPDYWRGDVTVRITGGRNLPARLSLSVCEMPGDNDECDQRYVVGLLYFDRAHAELSRQLQQADRLATIGLLAGSAAHEIKNDLGPLLGYLSLLEDNDPEHMVDYMRESVRRIHEHVEQILRPLRPRIRTRGAVVLLHSVRDILELLKRAGRLRRVNLVVEGEDDIVVMADKDEVHQIGVNLITNALDALGDGNGTQRGNITIRIQSDGPSGILEVQDDGAGIPDDLRPRVFEPFFTTKEQGGTGLGLPVVHDIVRSLRGRVQLESRIGEGTTVSVRLPLYSASDISAVEEI